MSNNDIDEDDTIVSSNGTNNCYFGFAGDDEPRYIVSSDGVDAKSNDINQIKESQLYVPPSDTLNAFKYNTIINWSMIEKIYENGFKYLYKDKLSSLIASRTMATSSIVGSDNKSRLKFAEIMFEKFGIDGLSDNDSATFSLYASGRTTGIVLESGHHKTSTIAIFEGYSLPHSIRSIGCGGIHITHYLKTLINKNTLSLTDIHRIKEKHCYISNGKDDNQQTFKLPDGTVLRNELFECTEILFNPFLIDYTENDYIYSDSKENCKKIVSYLIRHNTKYSNINNASSLFTVAKQSNIFTKNMYNKIMGVNSNCMNIINNYYNGKQQKYSIQQLINETINLCDDDIKNKLWNNIVLANGNTLFNGIEQRVKDELNKFQSNYSISIIAPPERKTSAWIGGSIIGSLGCHWGNDPYCRKKDWDEEGATAWTKKMIK